MISMPIGFDNAPLPGLPETRGPRAAGTEHTRLLPTRNVGPYNWASHFPEMCGKPLACLVWPAAETYAEDT